MTTRAAGVAMGAIAAALVAEGLPAGALAPDSIQPVARLVASPVIGAVALAAVATSAAAAAVVAQLVSRSGDRRHGGRREPTRGVAILPFVAGAILVAARVTVGGAIGSHPAGPLPDGDGPWIAVVESVGTPHDARQQAILRLDAGTGARIAANLPRFPVVETAERVEVSGRLSPPGGDGYGDYLRRNRLAGSLRAATVAELGRTDGAFAALEGLRRGAGDALARALPEPEGGLAAGILIGLRDRVGRDVAAAFTAAGVSHVVAISGWNIAIVAAAVAAVTGRWRRRRRAVMTLSAILCYTLLAGASASVVRAAAMAGVVSLAREGGRAIRASAALAWAAVALLLLEPRTVLDPGFQLSALATAGLIAWAAPLSARLGRLRRGRLSVPSWLAESLGVSLAAQAATLPLVLVLFGRLALVAPAVNLAVVPLVPASMAAGLFALVAGYAAGLGLPDPIVTVLALPAWLLLTMMIRIVEASAGLPFASLSLGPPSSFLAAGLAVALGLLVLRRGRVTSLIRALVAGRRSGDGDATAPLPARRSPSPVEGRRRSSGRRGHLRRPLLVLAGASLVVTLVAAARPDGRAHVTMLDVGQGDAILVESAQGGRLLVDGGPDPDRLLVLLDRRLPPWDRRLDLVVLTHPHEDHVAGLPLVLRRYRVGRVFAPGPRGEGPGYAAFVDALHAAGLRPEVLRTGDRLRLDEVALRVLWPDPSAIPETPPQGGRAMNDTSIVLLGVADGRTFLLTGDAEDDVDPTLIGRGLPHVDILKVAHHGSRTSTSDALLSAAAPSVALVSVGAGNSYGHPSPATLGRLATHRARTYRSDLAGTVTVALAPDRISIGGPIAGGASRLLYHPDDVRSGAGRGRLPAALPPPAGLVPAAFARRRRRRGVARRACAGTGPRARPGARRGCRAPPRRRQAPPPGRRRPAVAPRRGIRRAADPPRVPGARRARRHPPGHRAPRRAGVRAVAGRRSPRRPPGGVRRQAGRSAPRADGGAVRIVGAAVPDRTRPDGHRLGRRPRPGRRR